MTTAGTIILISSLAVPAIWFWLQQQKEKQERLRQRKLQREYKQAVEKQELDEYENLISSSVGIINSTKNNGTKISRTDLVIEKLTYLNDKYPHRVDIKESLDSAIGYRAVIHTEITEEKVTKLMDRSRLAKTLTGKLNSANKALEALKEAQNNIYVDQNKVSESVIMIQDYIHYAELKDIEEKAERFEFKENYKKALSYYQDALFFLFKDDIDDQLQQKEIKRLEQKIEELKGRVTALKLKS